MVSKRNATQMNRLHGYAKGASYKLRLVGGRVAALVVYGGRLLVRLGSRRLRKLPGTSPPKLSIRCSPICPRLTVRGGLKLTEEKQKERNAEKDLARETKREREEVPRVALSPFHFKRVRAPQTIKGGKGGSSTARALKSPDKRLLRVLVVLVEVAAAAAAILSRESISGRVLATSRGNRGETSFGIGSEDVK